MWHSSFLTKSTAVAFATALVLLTSPLLAQQRMPEGRGPPPGGPPGGPGGGKPPMMKMPDIDLKDVERAARTMFQDADVDRNGIATPAELDQIVKTRRDDTIRRRFADLDRNGDKTIDFGEFYAWQDGLGTRAHDDQGSRTYEMTNVPDAVPVPRGKGDDAEFLGMLLVPVSRMTLIEANTNYDEGVDLAEFVAFQRRAFDAADSDGNGRLQGDEVRRLLDSRRPTRTCVVAAQLPAPNGGPDGPPPPPGPGCERR